MDKTPKDQTISFRLSVELKAKALAAEKKTGAALSSMLVQATEAMVEYVEKHGEIRMPFVLVPRKEWEAVAGKAGKVPKRSAA